MKTIISTHSHHDIQYNPKDKCCITLLILQLCQHVIIFSGTVEILSLKDVCVTFPLKSNFIILFHFFTTFPK